MSNERRTIERILVGVDGSPGSALAVKWATKVALATGAEVIAAHVIEPPQYDLKALHLPAATLNEADWRESVTSETEATWCRPLIEGGVRHRTCLAFGRPGRCLTDLARSEQVDLVVTGRRGLRGITELTQGSVSYYVTHHAPCPVAVVPCA